MNKINLIYGKVTSYNTRGFGFINPISDSEENNRSIFFHISKVKDIKDRLLTFNETRNSDIFFWFTTEITEKGEALKECWINHKDIPNELIVELLISLENLYKEKNINNALTSYLLKTKKSNEIIVHDLPSMGNKKETINQYNLSESELTQINRYIEIYNKFNFTEHYEVNNYISKNNLWDEFPNLRSLNDHGVNKEIPGILPKYYSIVCKMLEIGSANGAPLDKATPY